MEAKRLMKVTYQDLKKGIRLNAYADAVIWSEDPSPTLAGLRFGGYAEVVRGLTDAIYGGATIEIEDVDGSFLTLKSLSKQYRREVSHEGLYAEATLIAEDEIQESSKSQDEKSRKHAQKDDLFDDNVPQQDIPAHICYIFCHPGNEDELFQAIDQKSYVPMIPEYQDYVLAELKRRRILRPLRVRSLYQELEAWKLCCEAKDQNLVRVMEDGLKRGKIKIPGASPGPSLLDGVHSVTDYLNTFGVTVAERIKKLFVPLFDPAAEPLSGEVLDINEYALAETEDGYGRLYHVDGITSSLIVRLEACPITLQEASAYVEAHHRHNAGPKFHKFSLCLRAPGEAEPVGVAIASIPKARCQMDGLTLEINRCCADPRYADVCSNLYARTIRIGREMGYTRFLTYTLPEESGSSLRAVGFQVDGVVHSPSGGWNAPSRPRSTRRYPSGDKVRWVLHTP